MKKPKAKLQNWSIIAAPISPYTAPEMVPTILAGEIYGHPNFPDGRKVITSQAVASKGVIVETENTIYTLGEVDVTYGLWCEEQGHIIDPKNPIKFVE